MHLARRERSVLLALLAVLVVSVSGCAPSVAGMSNAALKRCMAYQGRIHTMAVVLDWGSVDDNLQQAVYSAAVREVYDNPCTRVHFDIVERNNLRSLLREQNLIKNAYVDNSDGPRLGRLLGANYVLFVRVDMASLQQVDTGNLIAALTGSNTRIQAWIADVGVSVRLVDTETGLVVTQAYGSATSALPSYINVDGTYGSLDTRSLALQAAFEPAVQDAVATLMVRL